jgi:meso-butanediol dehydrogenase / (S,S)-butanediol dehydrogenase / diacetyl reductase
MARLDNTVVMITGGAQGIGEGIARRLASERAAIAIADLNADKAKAVAETLKGEGAAGAISVQVDVGDRGQVQAAIKAVVDSFGRLDVLFNNGGFNKPLPFLDVDEANFNNIMRVNAWGVMLGIQEGAKQMIVQGGGGKIINTASIAGRRAMRSLRPTAAASPR